MIRLIKRWFKNHIGYEVIGHYYKTDKNGIKIKKQIKKYYIKKEEKTI